MTNTPYLLNLNPDDDQNRPWFPNIDLTKVPIGNKRIVITHDWHVKGAFKSGAFTVAKLSSQVHKLEVVSLIDYPGVVIVNEGNPTKDYIFETTPEGHKGLMAISIPDDIEFFIVNAKYDPVFNQTIENIFFEPNASDIFKELIVEYFERYSLFDETNFHFDDWLHVDQEVAALCSKCLPFSDHPETDSEAVAAITTWVDLLSEQHHNEEECLLRATSNFYQNETTSKPRN